MELLLDTDIGTDVDDALALAFAPRHPDIELRTVTTVSGDPVKRAHIAKKLLLLAGRDDVEVAAGIPTPLDPVSGPSAWGGHEGRGLLADGEKLPISARGAVSLLLDECDGVDIAVIGMPSNVAAAIERDGSFVQRVRRVGFMGGAFSPPPSGAPPFAPSDDHNLQIDKSSSLVALNAGLAAVYVPGEVTVQTRLTESRLDRLRNGDELCRALARLVEVWAPLLHRSTNDTLPSDTVAVLHDPLTVQCLADPGFVTIERVPVSVVLHRGLVRTFLDPLMGRDADVVTSVRAQDFSEYFLDALLS